MLRSLGPASLGTADAINIAPLLDWNQSATPISGETVVMADNALDGVLLVMPSTLLLALTIVLPTEANSRIGQQRNIYFNKAITVLTMNGATSIINNPVAALLNSLITLIKVAPNTWVVS